MSWKLKDVNRQNMVLEGNKPATNRDPFAQLDRLYLQSPEAKLINEMYFSPKANQIKGVSGGILKPFNVFTSHVRAPCPGALQDRNSDDIAASSPPCKQLTAESSVTTRGGIPADEIENCPPEPQSDPQARYRGGPPPPTTPGGEESFKGGDGVENVDDESAVHVDTHSVMNGDVLEDTRARNTVRNVNDCSEMQRKQARKIRHRHKKHERNVSSSRTKNKEILCATENDTHPELESMVDDGVAVKDIKKERITLERWTIKPAPGGTCVEGYRRDEDTTWQSSVIQTRLQRLLVQTQSGSIYQLVGPLHRESGLAHGYGGQLLTKFRQGFPSGWQTLLENDWDARIAAGAIHDAVDDEKPLEEFKKIPVKFSTEPKIPSNPRRKVSQRSKSSQGKGRRKTVSSSTSSPVVMKVIDLPRSRSGRKIKPPLAWWKGQRVKYHIATDETIIEPGTNNPSFSDSNIQFVNEARAVAKINASILEIAERGRIARLNRSTSKSFSSSTELDNSDGKESNIQSLQMSSGEKQGRSAVADVSDQHLVIDKHIDVQQDKSSTDSSMCTMDCHDGKMSTKPSSGFKNNRKVPAIGESQNSSAPEKDVLSLSSDDEEDDHTVKGAPGAKLAAVNHSIPDCNIQLQNAILGEVARHRSARLQIKARRLTCYSQNKTLAQNVATQNSGKQIDGHQPQVDVDVLCQDFPSPSPLPPASSRRNGAKSRRSSRNQHRFRGARASANKEVDSNSINDHETENNDGSEIEPKQSYSLRSSGDSGRKLRSSAPVKKSKSNVPLNQKSQTNQSGKTCHDVPDKCAGRRKSGRTRNFAASKTEMKQTGTNVNRSPTSNRSRKHTRTRSKKRTLDESDTTGLSNESLRRKAAVPRRRATRDSKTTVNASKSDKSDVTTSSTGTKSRKQTSKQTSRVQDKENKASKQTLNECEERVKENHGEFPSNTRRGVLETTEEEDESRPWTESEIQLLQIVMTKIDPTDYQYWEKVAAQVGHTAEECQSFQHRAIPSTMKKKPNKAKQNEKVLHPNQITGGIGTMKRKRQFRELLDNHNADYEDDFFDSTPFKKSKPINFAGLSDTNMSDIWTNVKTYGFQTPASNTPRANYSWMPTSTHKTPASSALTPGLLRSVDRNAADAYIHQLKNRKHDRRPPAIRKALTSEIISTPKSALRYPEAASTTGLFEKEHIRDDGEDSETDDYYFSDVE